jgi:LPXTG-motif cell wall-anchored protein
MRGAVTEPEIKRKTYGEELSEMEKTAYFILIMVTVAWIIAWVIGMFQNIWIAIIGLAMLIGFGLLFIKALTDRIKNSKQDRYSRDIEK